MKVFVIVFLVCLFAFGVAWMRVEINRSGRNIGELQKEVDIKEARNQYLELEISRLSSPENVSRVAQEKLGMVQQEPHQVIVLQEK